MNQMMDQNQNPTAKTPPCAPAEPRAKRFDPKPLLCKVLPHLPLVFCALAALFAFALAVYFIVGPAEGYFHSDCTDTILWAQATFDSGEIISSDFTYAAILPFGASLWLIPLIAVFGVTMQTHVIGMIVFAVLFLLSTVLLLRRMKWSYAWCFGTAALLFMILSSSEKLLEIMWNHVIYYSLGLLLLFVMLAVAFIARDTVENEKAKPWLRLAPLAGLLLLSVLNATNGFQMLVLTALPVAVGFSAERLLDRETRIVSKKNLPALLTVVSVLLGTLLGMILLKYLLGDVSAGYANAYSSYSDPKDWVENIDKFFMNWLTLLGMNVRNGDPLMKLDSIVNMLRIGVGFLLLFVPFVLLACYRKIGNRYVRVLVWAHAFLFAFLFFGSVCGRLGAANWRLTPLLGSSVVVSVAAVKELWDHRKTAIVSFRAGVLLLAVLALLSGVNARTIAKMPADYGRDNDLHVLAEALENEGLTYGYATFWRSQAITLLSDSKVKVREILVESDEIVTDMYQSQGAWYEDQEGVDEYFILLSDAEYKKISTTIYWRTMIMHCKTRAFTVNGYHVFVFAENIWNPHTGASIVNPAQP